MFTEIHLIIFFLHSSCWLRPLPFYVAFVSVVALVVVANLIIFVLVTIQLYRMSKRQAKLQAHAPKKPWASLRALASIFTLLGLAWLSAFIYTGSSTSAVIAQYIFVVAVTLQGFAIFVFYCVIKKEARRKIAELCGCSKLKAKGW